MYAFAGQDREEQKREELVDFVGYLAFLDSVRNTTLSDDTPPATSAQNYPREIQSHLIQEPKLKTHLVKQET